MHSLGHSKRIAALILAAFVLCLASAVAAPLLKPGNGQWVCSAGGVLKMLEAGDDEGDQHAAGGMDCPLCASVTLPPPAALQFERPSPLAHALQVLAVAHIASVTAPPLPSRGPPVARL